MTKKNNFLQKKRFVIIGSSGATYRSTVKKVGLIQIWDTLYIITSLDSDCHGLLYNLLCTVQKVYTF